VVVDRGGDGGPQGEAGDVGFGEDDEVGGVGRGGGFADEGEGFGEGGAGVEVDGGDVACFLVVMLVELWVDLVTWYGVLRVLGGLSEAFRCGFYFLSFFLSFLSHLFEISVVLPATLTLGSHDFAAIVVADVCVCRYNFCCLGFYSKRVTCPLVLLIDLALQLNGLIGTLWVYLRSRCLCVFITSSSSRLYLTQQQDRSGANALRLLLPVECNPQSCRACQEQSKSLIVPAPSQIHCHNKSIRLGKRKLPCCEHIDGWTISD
jgi:hypothetical protein